MYPHNGPLAVAAALLALAPAVLAGAETALPVNPNLYPHWPWCVAVERLVPGDTCWALFRKHGLDLDRFLRMNPKLVRYPEPCNHLMAGEEYCVQDKNVVTSFAPKTTPPPPPPKTTPPPPPPKETPKPEKKPKWKTYAAEVPCPTAWAVPSESWCFVQTWNAGEGVVTMRKNRDPA